MTHQHNHHEHGGSRRLRTAFALNISFTVLEVIVGLWTNSVAILSDSVHDLGDSFTLGLSWYLENLADREGDSRFSYGYRRFSLLGALASTVVLLGGSIWVMSKAIPRLIQPEHTNAGGMTLFALVGIAVNGLAVLRLRGEGSTMNARVVAWHLLEDVLGWIAVLIVGVTLLFADLPILDPILSIVFTGYVLYNVLRNLRGTASLFMQAVPEEMELEAIEERFRKLPHVRAIHHTHIWSLDGQHHVLTSHIVVKDGTTADEIVDVKCDLRDVTKQFSLEHTTFEIEYESEECSMRPLTALPQEIGVDGHAAD